MAMLAEPRRKKRVINLQSKNAWTEDNNKFGQKMLESMGWSKGRGLGVREDGPTEHVKVRHKDDNAGLGFKDKNDQWTEHETSFNDLLRSLHGGDVDTKKIHSEKSLEEKSKNIRSRLHYKKFTRGKDISKYSEKDLANIFGKKSLNDKKCNIKKIEVIQNSTENKSYSFVAGGDMNDYFKSKFSNKLSIISNESKNDSNVESENDYNFVGFSNSEDNSKTGIEFNGFYSSGLSNYGGNDKDVKSIIEIEENEGYIKKKKKSKKRKSSDENNSIKLELVMTDDISKSIKVKDVKDIDNGDKTEMSENVKWSKKKHKKLKISECDKIEPKQNEILHNLSVNSTVEFKKKKNKKKTASV